MVGAASAGTGSIYIYIVMTFSPHFRTATGTSSTVPRTWSPLRNLVSEELPNARGPGYAARAPTPTPTSTPRTTA